MENAWYQQSLTPPDVIEVNARFGWIPSTDHAQWLVEVKDPVAGVLIGSWSMPHAQGEHAAERAVDALVERYRQVLVEQITSAF